MNFVYKLLFVIVILVDSSFGIDQELAFEDPALQSTYQELVNEIRCLVCQNQTIADSTAPLATDLKREIRSMIEEGGTKNDVIIFLTDRYGDFVLYNPPFQTNTLVLWSAPIIFLLFGFIIFIVILNRYTKKL
jgi:cytochrome c-type biogenesis protein CcmH|tara:strand:- start:1171 stop:1569 length:399 start_codon:yes stop_codon:yes gene_type:complete